MVGFQEKVLVFNFDDDKNGITKEIFNSNSREEEIYLTTNLEKRGLLDIHYDDEKREYVLVFPHAMDTGHAWFCFFD